MKGRVVLIAALSLSAACTPIVQPPVSGQAMASPKSLSVDLDEILAPAMVKCRSQVRFERIELDLRLEGYVAEARRWSILGNGQVDLEEFDLQSDQLVSRQTNISCPEVLEMQALAEGLIVGASDTRVCDISSNHSPAGEIKIVDAAGTRFWDFAFGCTDFTNMSLNLGVKLLDTKVREVVAKQQTPENLD